MPEEVSTLIHSVPHLAIQAPVETRDISTVPPSEGTLYDDTAISNLDTGVSFSMLPHEIREAKAIRTDT